MISNWARSKRWTLSRQLIADWDEAKWAGNTSNLHPAVLNLSAGESDILARIQDVADCKSPGDVASVQIGLVTGANEFFVLGNDGLEDAGLRGVYPLRMARGYHPKRWRSGAIKTRLGRVARSENT